MEVSLVYSSKESKKAKRFEEEDAGLTYDLKD